MQFLKNTLFRYFVVAGLALWGWGVPMMEILLAEESAYSAAVEYEVKAAFVHNFTKFIDWPPEAFAEQDSPFRIGIFGRGSMNQPLMNLNGKVVKGRLLMVSRVDDLNDVSGYHIIYINSSERKRLPFVLKSLKNTGVLTIGDMPGFTEQCGIINFFLENEKVRFEINHEVSLRENLHISSKLLYLARVVDSRCD